MQYEVRKVKKGEMNANKYMLREQDGRGEV